MIKIREEKTHDIHLVRDIHVKAFGRSREADLVDSLRHKCGDLLSLVALAGNDVVGHILFSPARLEGKDGMVEGMGLAPMAVLPEHQRKGIGSEMIKTGLDRLKSGGCPFVVVLGHPGYYPRFGFEPAHHHKIKSEWAVSDELFMVLMLNKLEMQGMSGVARYRPEFAALKQM